MLDAQCGGVGGGDGLWIVGGWTDYYMRGGFDALRLGVGFGVVVDACCAVR